MMKFTFQASILALCLALFVSVSIADDSSMLPERASKETENSKSIEGKEASTHGVGTLTDSNKSPSSNTGANTELERSKSVESDDAAAKGNGSLQDSNKQEPLGNGESVELERSKSIENIDIGKANDSKKIASLTSGTTHEMESEKSVENADVPAKGTGDLADSNKLASVVNKTNKEVERSKSVENADAAAKSTINLKASDESERYKSDDDDSALTQDNGKSDKIQPHEGATDDRSKKVNKSSGTLQALGDLADSIKIKATENQTLLTLTLGDGNKTEHGSVSYPKKDNDHEDKIGAKIDDLKIKASLRHPEQNGTDDKNFWNKWSSSNQLVPRTSLLAAGAVVCILVHKVSAGLGLD